MRIAIVCPYAWDMPGGVQTHVRSLAQTLVERGHEVAVIAPRARPRRAGGSTFETFATGRPVPVPAKGSIAPSAFGLGARSAEIAALERFKPDVIHAHEPLVPSVSMFALASDAAPVVATFHASTEASRGYQLARPVLERFLARAKVRTVVSDAARRLVERYFPGEYALTPNGVDRERFVSAPPADLGGGKKVLFLGRIERRKGLEVLIRAMSLLDGVEASLVVAGDGPRAAAARALAGRLGVEVEWLGRVDDDHVPRLYRGASVYCAPNTGGESFGIVLLEAMAASTPVVASDLPAFRAVADGAAAFASPGDPLALAAVLHRVLGSDEEALRLSTSGGRRAESFDWRRIVARVEDAYARAADG